MQELFCPQITYEKEFYRCAFAPMSSPSAIHFTQSLHFSYHTQNENLDNCASIDYVFFNKKIQGAKVTSKCRKNPTLFPEYYISPARPKMKQMVCPFYLF